MKVLFFFTLIKRQIFVARTILFSQQNELNQLFPIKPLPIGFVKRREYIS